MQLPQQCDTCTHSGSSCKLLLSFLVRLRSKGTRPQAGYIWPLLPAIADAVLTVYAVGVGVYAAVQGGALLGALLLSSGATGVQCVPKVREKET